MTGKLFLALTFCWAGLLAQGTSSGMSALKLPSQARPASLGDATVADISSISFFTNPALLGDAANLAFSLSHQQWIQSIRTEYLASVLPVAFGAIGFSASSTSIPGIEVREIPGSPIGEFTARSAIFNGAAGFQLDDAFSVGFAINYLYEKIYVDDANGFGLDLGASYRPPLPGLKLGLSLLHLGSMNRLRNERSNLPSNLLVGGSYDFGSQDLHVLLLATEYSGIRNHSNSFRTGIEATYMALISARLGYESGNASRRLTFGFGVHYENLLFDYGYVPFSFDLGSAHLITIGLSL